MKKSIIAVQNVNQNHTQDTITDIQLMMIAVKVAITGILVELLITLDTMEVANLDITKAVIIVTKTIAAKSGTPVDQLIPVTRPLEAATHKANPPVLILQNIKL